MCRHNVSVGGMGLAVMGGVFRQHFIRLVRELPGDQCIALAQLARQGFYLFLNLAFILPAEAVPQHPKDHGGIPVVHFLYRLHGLFQRRRFVGYALPGRAVLIYSVKQVVFAPYNAAVYHRVLVGDQPRVGVYAVIIDVVQAVAPHHAFKFFMGFPSGNGHVHQKNQVDRIGRNPFLVVADLRAGAGHVGVRHLNRSGFRLRLRRWHRLWVRCQRVGRQ